MAYYKPPEGIVQLIIIVLLVVLSVLNNFLMVNSQSPSSSAPAAHHKLSIVGTQAFVQAIKCRRLSSNSSVDDMDMSFSVIECSSRSECEDKLPCLRYNLKCAHREKVFRGEPCTTIGLLHIQNNSTITAKNGDCLVVDTKSVRHGLVECESKSKDNLTIHRTTDYFYKGIDTYLYLTSNSSSPKSSKFELRMEKQSVNLNSSNSPWNNLIYTSESIRLSCISSDFFYDSKTLKLTLLDKTGAPYKINEKLTHRYGFGGNSYHGLYQYRVPVQVAGFKCSAEGRNDSVINPLPQKRDQTFNFTTVDPPLDLTAKSMNGKIIIFTLNDTLGCKLTNASREQRVHLNRILFPGGSWGTQGADRTLVIESIIEFLRFREFSTGLYGCQILDGHHLIDTSTQHFDYIVAIVSSPPKILNTQNATQNFISLIGHAHRILKCKYAGIPTPYVTWLRDGQDILDPTTSWQTNYVDYDGDGFSTNEESILYPQSSTTTMNGSTSSKNGVVNYTCLVINHLGRDSFSFLIADDNGGGSSSPLGHSTTDCVAISWLLALMTLAFLVTLCISMRHYLWMLLDKYKKEDQQQLQLEVQPE